MGESKINHLIDDYMYIEVNIKYKPLSNFAELLYGKKYVNQVNQHRNFYAYMCLHSSDRTNITELNSEW